MNEELHFCDEVEKFSINKFLQFGVNKGKNILIVGESPAMNGWIKSGRAFYTVEGKLLPSGRNLNKLLSYLDLDVEKCGFTELVKCCVGKNRKQLSKCVPKWKNIFEKQVALCQPKLIIILGVETTRIFNLMFETNLIMGDIGEMKLGKLIVEILSIYHPSPIAPKNQGKNIEIFEKQKDKLRGIIG